jgi:hypothetical protein
VNETIKWILVERMKTSLFFLPVILLRQRDAGL